MMQLSLTFLSVFVRYSQAKTASVLRYGCPHVDPRGEKYILSRNPFYKRDKLTFAHTVSLDSFIFR